MDGISFATSHGELHMVGRVHVDPSRPVLLIVGGSFPPKDVKHEVIEQFPKATVLVCRYPGMHSVAWDDPSPANVAAGLDEFIGAWLRGRRIIAYGNSTGCLATLNLRSREVVHQIAQEPFLTTAHLKPMVGYCRDAMAKLPDNKALSTYAWTIFGVSPTELADRDYRAFASDRTLPLDLIVGAKDPLSTEPQPWPSFTLAEDRQVLLDRPQARLHVGPPGTGHYIEANQEAKDMVTRCLTEAIASVQAMPQSAS